MPGTGAPELLLSRIHATMRHLAPRGASPRGTMDITRSQNQGSLITATPNPRNNAASRPKGLRALRYMVVSEREEQHSPCSRHVPRGHRVRGPSGLEYSPLMLEHAKTGNSSPGRGHEFRLNKKTFSHRYEGTKLKISCKDCPGVRVGCNSQRGLIIFEYTKLHGDA
jgi:hypothetical protein